MDMTAHWADNPKKNNNNTKIRKIIVDLCDLTLYIYMTVYDCIWLYMTVYVYIMYIYDCLRVKRATNLKIVYV